MTLENKFASRPIDKRSLITRMLVGAGIGLALVTFFLIGNTYTRPEWGQFWMLRPLIITPLAAAGGGLGTYFMQYMLGYKGGSSKVIAVIISIIGFLISLWLGTVLGFAGTLWN
ncbi:potassium transporter KefB [Pedobacter boryungensis]|uniref:Potassium transporter KefB n=1 Tax=Pedobacter boryungensis TaxID=869962 RepID=A0ABX2DAG7_9SPHI|nr:potassium transporter KefB [Pedobacter boryungensis]NQX31048.1 potassium transporter KefB [Pedobacter boryungensis]